MAHVAAPLRRNILKLFSLKRRFVKQEFECIHRLSSARRVYENTFGVIVLNGGV